MSTSSSSSTSHAKHYPESSLNPALNQRKSNLNGNSRRPSLFTQTSQSKVQRSVTICGPMGVGKTSICNVLCNPNSAEHVKNTNSYRPTVEDEFVVNTKIKDEQGLSKNVQLTVLDTMGNDNQNMGVMVPDRFVTSKDGFIVVYDVSCKRSFTQATTFLEQLINDNNIDPEEYAILLVGNKKDKLDNPEKLKEIEDRVIEQKKRMQEQDDYYDEADLGIVDDEEAQEFCDENFLLEPLFISATSSTDVGHVFNTLCNRIEDIKAC